MKAYLIITAGYKKLKTVYRFWISLSNNEAKHCKISFCFFFVRPWLSAYGFVFVHSFRCFVRINNWRFHNFSGKMKEHRSWFHISKVSLIVCLSLDLDFLAYFSDSIKVSIGNDVIETYWICCAVWFGSVCVVCLKLNLIQVSKSDLILLCFVQLIHVWLLFLNIRSESLCSDSFCGWSIISLCIFQKKIAYKSI